VININKNVLLEGQLLEEYQVKVAQRLNLKGWNLPIKWRNKVKPIFEECKKENINTVDGIRLYVKMIFQNFPRSKCLRLYRMKYPPIFLLKNKYSLINFQNFLLTQESYERKNITDLEIIKIVKKEYAKTNCSITGNVDTEQLKFSIVSGKVSKYTVAYVAILFEFSKELLNEINELIKTVNNENFVDTYRIIKNLIDKGALKNVKTFEKSKTN